MPPKGRSAVLRAVYRLARASQGDIKKLQDQRPPQWRLRVGNWRVIYQRDDDNRALVILRITDRKDAY